MEILELLYHFTSAAIERPIKATYSNGNNKMHNKYIGRLTNYLYIAKKYVMNDIINK